MFKLKVDLFQAQKESKAEHQQSVTDLQVKKGTTAASLMMTVVRRRNVTT